MTVELITRYVKVLILFAVLGVVIWIWNTQGCRKVPGPDMEPSIKRDKYTLVRPGARDPGRQVDRGDVVFYTYAAVIRGQQPEHVARVMGLPGDRVKIVKGEVFVNGEKAQDVLQPTQRGAEDYEEVIVPRDSFFVLCDNRKTARNFDSRVIGPLGKWAILGKIK